MTRPLPAARALALILSLLTALPAAAMPSGRGRATPPGGRAPRAPRTAPSLSPSRRTPRLPAAGVQAPPAPLSPAVAAPAAAPAAPQAAPASAQGEERTASSARETLSRAGEALQDPARAPENVVSEAFGEAPRALGIDLSAMDASVRPQDDFFRHVNGAWLRDFEIPADRSDFGPFDALHDKSELAVKEIIQGADARAADEDDRRIADLYASFMDEAAADAAGADPVAAELARIDRVRSKAELPGVFALLGEEGVSTPLGLGVFADSRDPERNVVYAGQAGLGLPDREYYFEESEDAGKVRAAYVDLLTRLFSLAGEPDARRKAQTVFALEKELAAHHWKKEELRDPVKTYNKTTRAELAAKHPGFDWATYLRRSGVPDSEGSVVIETPGYFEGLDRVLAARPLADWRLYLKARVLNSASAYLSSDFVKAGFEYGRVLSGQTEMRPRWKKGVALVNGLLGEVVGKAYVREHFSESSKARMKELIANLQAAFAERIKGLAWMSEETKARALEKLSKFTAKIGYPDVWRGYAGLEIRRGDLLGNVRRAARFEHARAMAKLGKPVDRSEWLMHPQEVNAYYLPHFNDIVFPAAFLQAPFFNPEADDAVNYGAIGAVIGHEMGHGFDDGGSQYDGDGRLRQWWTDADRAGFLDRVKVLIEQFNAIEVLPGLRINGELTQGENIGDLAGVVVAFLAYQMSLKGAEAPVIAGFTGAQRFFMGWAQAWRVKARDEAVRSQVKTDPHSPAEARVNGVMPNVDAFHEAFGVKPGDGMHRAPGDRARIW